MNNFKDKLQKQVCIGTFLKIPRPEIVEIFSIAGFDFIICDMEHAQISEQEAREVIRTAVNMNLPVIVRLPDASQGLVNRLLEAGATGIQIPRLKSQEDIQHLASIMHYPPNGTRSIGNANRAAGYGTVPLREYLDQEDERVITVGQFETREMEQPSENLFKGLDVAFIGPVDLTMDFGVLGNINDPAVQERIKEIEENAKKTGTILGAFAGNIDAAKRYIDRGYNYIAVSGDVGLLMSGAKNLISDMKTLSN